MGSEDSYWLDRDAYDWPTVLRGWRDLRWIPSRVRVWLVSCFGEPIMIFEDESVHKLDPASGSVDRLATNRDEFSDLLEEDDELARDWFMVPLVDEAREAGLSLSSGQCYGFTIPTVLVEGDYSLSNVRVRDLAEYHAFLADFHGQIDDVPDGGLIRFDWTD